MVRSPIFDLGRLLDGERDADARDVILLLGFLTGLDEAEWDMRAQRLLDIILDGLRR